MNSGRSIYRTGASDQNLRCSGHIHVSHGCAQSDDSCGTCYRLKGIAGILVLCVDGYGATCIDSSVDLHLNRAI